MGLTPHEPSISFGIACAESDGKVICHQLFDGTKGVASLKRIAIFLEPFNVLASDANGP
jgi:hypothetical protein